MTSVRLRLHVRGDRASGIGDLLIDRLEERRGADQEDAIAALSPEK
jgi:hypothetical protein